MKRNYTNPQLIYIQVCDVVATSSSALSWTDEGNENNINSRAWVVDKA